MRSALEGGGLASLSSTLSCGRLGPAMLGRTVPRSSSTISVKTGSAAALLDPHALGLGVGFHEGDAVLGPAGEAEVVEGGAVDGEDAAGGAVFGGHVGDGKAGGDGELVQARAEELDELADDALLAEDLGDVEGEVGRGAAFGEGARRGGSRSRPG